MFNVLSPNPFVRNVKYGYDKINKRLAIIPFTWDNFIDMDSLLNYISTVNINQYEKIKLKKYDKKFIKDKDLINLFLKFFETQKIYGEDNFYKRTSKRFSELKTYQQKLLVRLFIFQIFDLIEERDFINQKLVSKKFYFTILIDISDTFESNKHLFFNTCIDVFREMNLIEDIKLLKIIKMEKELE